MFPLRLLFLSVFAGLTIGIMLTAPDRPIDRAAICAPAADFEACMVAEGE